MDEAEVRRGVISGAGPVAVVDIGSNSVRLVVYERLARTPTPFFNEKTLAGLGAGVAETGELAAGPVDMAVQALHRYAALCRQMRVASVTVVATAAVREASNGAAFLATVEDIFTVPVRVLSGTDEARYSALGAISGTWKADGIAGDLGGGSLELADIAGGKTGPCESFRLGGLALQARAAGSIKAARALVREDLDGSLTLSGLKRRTFYAVGGTWRSLAKLHRAQSGYPLNVDHAYRLDGPALRDFLDELIRGPEVAVPSIETVSRQRRPLLPYGALVLRELVRIGKPAAIVVSALGLREGLLYEALPDEERDRDPLVSAAEELALLRARSPAHAAELVAWTAQAMAALDIDETAGEARLRTAACHLSDIGWRAHPDYRGTQSLNIIANADFVGTDHAGRAYLALAAFYRHSGLTETDLGSGLRELATPRYRERARALAAILRVAYLISASMPGVLPKTAIRRQAKVLQLVFPGELAALAGGRLEARFAQLAALGGYSAMIRIGG